MYIFNIRVHGIKKYRRFIKDLNLTYRYIPLRGDDSARADTIRKYSARQIASVRLERKPFHCIHRRVIMADNKLRMVAHGTFVNSGERVVTSVRIIEEATVRNIYADRAQRRSMTLIKSLRSNRCNRRYIHVYV